MELIVILAAIAILTAASLAAWGTYKVCEIVYPRIGHWASEIRAQIRYERTGDLGELAASRRVNAL